MRVGDPSGAVCAGVWRGLASAPEGAHTKAVFDRGLEGLLLRGSQEVMSVVAQWLS